MPQFTSPSVIRPMAVLTTAVLGLSLSACSSSGTSAGASATASGYPLTIEDCGKQVTLDKVPEHILTVGAAAVELLDAAGASERITARTGEFGAPLPEGLKHPPSHDLIIDPSDPTTEEILSASPDLVLGYGLFNADVEQLNHAGIVVLTVQAECGHDTSSESQSATTLSTITKDLRRLGTALSTSAVAEAAADELDERISRASREDTGQSAAWVYYFSSEDSLSAYGGSGLPGSALREAGLSNVYDQHKEAYLTISTESLLEQQPHWIILTYGLYGETKEEARAKFLAEAGIQSLTAVAQDRLVLLPASASVSGPSAITGLEQLVKATQG